MRSDAHDDIEVAGRPPVPPRGAPALQTDALAVADPGRDAPLHLPRPQLVAGTPACGAGALDDHAPAAALGARLAQREQTLVVIEHAPARAAGADDRRRARRGSGAVARGARRVAGEVH